MGDKPNVRTSEDHPRGTLDVVCLRRGRAAAPVRFLEERRCEGRSRVSRALCPVPTPSECRSVSGR